MGGAISRSCITNLLAAVTFAALPMLAALEFAASALAAEKTLSWWHDDCGYSVSFDPAKEDEARLRNTVHLIYGPPDFKAPSVGLPFNPHSVARLNLDHTRRECQSALDVAGRLEFIALAGIDDYRRALMDEIRDTCEFETVQIRGFKEPSALRDYQPAAACSPYVDALEGKRDIMAAFQQTVSQRCTGADQVSCIDRTFARAQKNDGGDWVRLYLTKFGWNNCAVDFTSRSVDGRKLEQMRAGLEEQFRSAFRVTKNRCEAAAGSRPGFRTVSAAPLGALPPGKAAPPASASSPAAKNQSQGLRCRNPTAAAHVPRPDAEQALCAAAHTPHRASFAVLSIAAADRSRTLIHSRR